jgi:hypothetical protein
MIARYGCNFFSGAGVGRRMLIGGLAVAAFAMTLAFFALGDMWRSDTPPLTRAVAPPDPVAAPIPEPAPAAAAINSPQTMAPAEPAQEAPNSTADVDDRATDRAKVRDRGDRTAARGSRSR